MHRGRYAAVLGLAAALGCAVSLSQRVLVDLLQSFIFGLGLLLHPDVPAVVKAGIALRQWSDDAFHAGVWQTRYDLGWDLAVYYGLAPLLTVLVAIGYAAFCRVRSIRPVSESGSRS